MRSTGAAPSSGASASRIGRFSRNRAVKMSRASCSRSGWPLDSASLILDHLPRVVPLVDRRRDVEALVALQTDEAPAERARQHLRDLGLADARLAFEEERPPHPSAQGRRSSRGGGRRSNRVRRAARRRRRRWRAAGVGTRMRACSDWGRRRLTPRDGVARTTSARPPARRKWSFGRPSELLVLFRFVFALAWDKVSVAMGDKGRRRR